MGRIVFENVYLFRFFIKRKDLSDSRISFKSSINCHTWFRGFDMGGGYAKHYTRQAILVKTWMISMFTMTMIKSKLRLSILTKFLFETPIKCSYLFSQLILLGTDDGLFALNPQSTSGRQHLVQLSGFGSVHYAAEAKGVERILLLTGQSWF